MLPGLQKNSNSVKEKTCQTPVKIDTVETIILTWNSNIKLALLLQGEEDDDHIISKRKFKCENCQAAVARRFKQEFYVPQAAKRHSSPQPVRREGLLCILPNPCKRDHSSISS